MRIAGILVGAWLALAGAAHAEQVMDEPRPAGVKVVSTDEGPVYADAATGKTLYTWSGDSQPYKSLCNDDHYVRIEGQAQVKFQLPDVDSRKTCQQVWPAFHATGAPVGKWGVITRDDGSRQWTYAGKPLYTTILDKGPGDAYGEDLSLYAARRPLAAPPLVPPSLSVAMTTEGRTLTTMDGWTVYTSDADPVGKSLCEDACAKTWVPVLAPELAPPKADWSLVRRADGSRQWAFHGKPLYTYADEERRRDLGGEAVPHWKAAILQPAPQRPAGITVQVTSAGDVYADSQGRTLYMFRCAEEAPDAMSCDTLGSSSNYRLTICGGPEKCMALWRPVAAAAGARNPNKIWTVVKIDPRTGDRVPDTAEGMRVWAFKGRPVLTYALDQVPGDYKGHEMRVFSSHGFSMMLTSNN